MNTGCFLPYVGLGSNLLHIGFVKEFAKKNGKITVFTFSKSLPDTLKYEPDIKETLLLEKVNRVVDIPKLSLKFKKSNVQKLYIFKSSIRYYLSGIFAGIETHSYPFYKKKNLHLVEEGKRFTQNKLGLVRFENNPKLYLERRLIDQVKKNMPVDKKKILIAPSSSGPTTMWGTNYFVELMKKLEEKFDCIFFIALDSSEKEINISKKILNEFKDEKIKILAKKKISELMPIISCCDISICNDTSFQHLSCQLNVPTIILRFDTPSAYSSYSKLQYSILPKGYSEVDHNTKANPSLISVDTVLERSLQILSS